MPEMTGGRAHHGTCADHRARSSARLAVERALALAGSWAKESPERRALLVQNLSRTLVSHQETLARLIACEIGKPIRFARVEVQRTAEMLCVVAGRFATGLDDRATQAATVRRRPHGVVAVVTPWNNPVYLALGKIAPAVLCGNTVVWKPAPQATAVSNLVVDYLDEAGWPGGLVTAVMGGHREALTVIDDPSVAAVTLTGSLSAGESAHEICTRRRVPFQAELGGNNAAIVWPDADLALAARSVAAGAFEMAGQRCTANRRVIVEASCRERFLSMLIQETAALVWGDPLQDDTQIGPLVNAFHRQRVGGAVDRAIAGRREVQAIRPHGRDCPELADPRADWYPPTIICCDLPGDAIVQDETFGPVLVVQTAAGWDEAIGLCNGVTQGLAAAIFTRSRTIAERFTDQAAAGILKINQSTADAAVDLPFGGWKASGLGPPEHGAFDREFYTRPQTVYDLLSIAS